MFIRYIFQIRGFNLKRKNTQKPLTPSLHKIIRKAFQDNIHSPAIFGFYFKNKKLYYAS